MNKTYIPHSSNTMYLNTTKYTFTYNQPNKKKQNRITLEYKVNQAHIIRKLKKYLVIMILNPTKEIIINTQKINGFPHNRQTKMSKIQQQPETR